MTKMFEAKLAELSKVPVELEKHHRIEEFDQRIEEAGASGRFYKRVWKRTPYYSY